MRPKTLILFIVAIGCGLVASIGVSQYMEKNKATGGGVETAKIYVATSEISPGDRLEAKNVSLEEWPKDRIPEGYISDLKQLEEKFSRYRLYKGEPILAPKLADTMDGNYSQTIPEGYRVVAVKVDENSNAGGLVRPGDRVDLVVFLRKNADIPETGTHTILRDVNVFAVGGKIEREVDKQGASREVRTVSLLVTPKQAESVMLAKELGVLSLSLRRPGDTSEEIGEGETIVTLLGKEGEDANEHKRKAKQDTAPDPSAQWLSSAIQPPPAPVEPPPPPVFTMKIRSNNSDKTFVWHKMDGQPQEADEPAPPSSEKPVAVPATPNQMPTLPLPGLMPVRDHNEQPPVVDHEPPTDEGQPVSTDENAGK